MKLIHLQEARYRGKRTMPTSDELLDLFWDVVDHSHVDIQKGYRTDLDPDPYAKTHYSGRIPATEFDAAVQKIASVLGEPINSNPYGKNAVHQNKPGKNALLWRFNPEGTNDYHPSQVYIYIQDTEPSCLGKDWEDFYRGKRTDKKEHFCKHPEQWFHLISLTIRGIKTIQDRTKPNWEQKWKRLKQRRIKAGRQI